MAEGRELNGVFAPGNRIGRGNAGNRKIAELRRALLEAVTSEQIQNIADSLYKQAVTGDVQAAKVLLEFALGKPVAAVEISVPEEPSGMSLDELVQVVLSELTEFPEARWRLASALARLGKGPAADEVGD